MQSLSLAFGYAGTIAAVLGFQLKKQRQIVISQCIANLLVALSYVVLSWTKISGGAICIVAAVHTFINYTFLKKDKTPPKMIGVIFFFAYVAVSVLTIVLSGEFRFPYDLLPLFGAIALLFGVSTSDPRKTRLFFFVNTLIWITYDFMAAPVAVANLVTHIFILCSVVTGIIRYDILKK